MFLFRFSLFYNGLACLFGFFFFDFFELQLINDDNKCNKIIIKQDAIRNFSYSTNTHIATQRRRHKQMIKEGKKKKVEMSRFVAADGRVPVPSEVDSCKW